jgi:glyoxylase-like metal-dependent hydrolase (beta-lactamase superfamily II)
MNRIEVEKDILLYQFPPVGENAFGSNIYVLLDGQDAFMLDAGYEEQAKEVLNDLQARGCELRQGLVSHFHPDHISGLLALPLTEVFGSAEAGQTLLGYTRETIRELPFVQKLTESSTFQFGTFTFAFRFAPGHSPCSLYTIINGRYVHVADNLIAANDDTLILPWAPFEKVGEHIRSLELLKELNPEVLLLGHGNPVRGGAIAEEIAIRQQYLQRVMNGEGKISLEEATAGWARLFLGGKWHIHVEE